MDSLCLCRCQPWRSTKRFCQPTATKGSCGWIRILCYHCCWKTSQLALVMPTKGVKSRNKRRTNPHVYELYLPVVNHLSRIQEPRSRPNSFGSKLLVCGTIRVTRVHQSQRCLSTKHSGSGLSLHFVPRKNILIFKIGRVIHYNFDHRSIVGDIIV